MIIKKVYGYDFETYPNIFTATFIDKDQEDEPIVFEISVRKNQFGEMLEFVKTKVLGLIGYNCLSFDSQILEWFFKNQYLVVEEYYTILAPLMEQVNIIINSKYPAIPEWKLTVPNLDVFKYMHFDRFGVSLKWCEYMLDSPNLEDLPHVPNKNVPEEDFDELIAYNINDVVETLRVFFYSKKSVELRKTLSTIYGRDLMNKSDTAIGKMIMLDGYSKLMGVSGKSIQNGGNTSRDLVLPSDVINDLVQFKTPELQLFLRNLKLDPTNLVTDKFSIKVNTLTCQHEFAKGGLHSICKKGVYESGNGYTIRDIDWGSYYPSLMIKLGIYPEHLGPQFLIFLNDLTERRLHAKRTGDDVTNKALKISINSIYGLLGEIYGWIHDYKALYSVTLNGELILLMLIEELEMIDPRIKCYYSNTDGATFMVPDELLDKFNEVGEQFRQDVFNAELEYVDFEKQILSDVNNFMVIKPDGYTKEKGKFISDEKDLTLNKNKSYMCVPKALKEYYINGVPIIETLKANGNIFDFCAGKRAKKTPGSSKVTFELTTMVKGDPIVEPLSKTLRYYISNKGGLLEKVFYDEFNEPYKREMVEACPITGDYYRSVPFNKYVEKENYDINYKFYERLCNKIIENITANTNQLTLF
jgi:hypothetical protein